MGQVLREVAFERERQLRKHGDNSHLPDGTGPDLLVPFDGRVPRSLRRADYTRWARKRADRVSQSAGDGTIAFEHVLTEEWAEAIAESDPARLRAELIQVAAVAVQWVEAIDKREGGATHERG